MNWMKWLPWRFIIRHAAQNQGFLDPVALLSRLHRFAQPSEVAEPIELLRAGVVFHARGLINSRVVQHNLDWVWPYWIERQFDPYDESFIPRAFSITQVNLSHRNWTAIGYPDCPEIPIVDPRGLLTPFLDSWSLDGWLLTEDGRCLLPSREAVSDQRLDLENGASVITETGREDLQLKSHACVELESGRAVCKLTLSASSQCKAWIILALRPQNPEGVSFIQKVNLSTTGDSWTIDGHHHVQFSTHAEHHHVSDYDKGDVHIHLADGTDQAEGACRVGMVTAAALFPLTLDKRSDQTADAATGKRWGQMTASIPLTAMPETKGCDDWPSVRQHYCQLQCPEPRYQFLYDAAVTSLILHSPDDVFPGPYTYRRFWFRDAAFIIHALLCVGLNERAKRALDRFPERQKSNGYFLSQEGEWDSNGEVLWILQRYCELTGQTLDESWHKPVTQAAKWIMRKRLKSAKGKPHAGLLPPGFSAEHLGPNDYYYWDDFWGIAGLQAGALLSAKYNKRASKRFAKTAEDFKRAVDHSLLSCEQRLGRPAMPASPYRRLDAGAIGSVAMAYPLQLNKPDDPRVLDSIEFLLENCFVKGAFFQDMIHSGLNVYLTLQVAQVLLRNNDPRYLALMDTVRDLASPTGQWPEAIHPNTGGGCMGDGHHVWASAEWVLMIRYCFVREETSQLVLCAGIPSRWLDEHKPIRFGPAPTRFGSLWIEIICEPDQPTRVQWTSEWHDTQPDIEIRLPGYNSVLVESGTTFAELTRCVT